MPSNFAGVYWRTKDVEDKSATRTGSLAEGHVDQYAMGGNGIPTDPGKNMRRLFDMSTVFMMASREKRSVLRRDWRNQRFLKEQAIYNTRAEEEAASAVRERKAGVSEGRRRKAVRIQSDPWTEWRDAHQKRQAEAAREKYLEGLRSRPKELTPLDQFLVPAVSAPATSDHTTNSHKRSTSQGADADGGDSSSSYTPVSSDARSTVTATSTSYEPPIDDRHHVPVLGLLSAVKREAASLAKESRKHKKATSADAIVTKRDSGTAEQKDGGDRQRERKTRSTTWADDDHDDDFRPKKKLTKKDRTDSDLLDMYDDAAVSLMSGFSGNTSRTSAPTAAPKRKVHKKTPTWDMHDDMTVHFIASLAGARSASPGGESGLPSGSAPKTSSNSTVSPVSPETPGAADALDDASRRRETATTPRIPVTAQ